MTIDGPLASLLTLALDPSTTTSRLSQVWPPWDPGQNRPAEPFHSATQPPSKSIPHLAGEQKLQAPTRRQVQSQGSPTAPTSGPQELRRGGSPQAWMPQTLLARRGLPAAQGGRRSQRLRVTKAPPAGVTSPSTSHRASFSRSREPRGAMLVGTHTLPWTSTHRFTSALTHVHSFGLPAIVAT